MVIVRARGHRLRDGGLHRVRATQRQDDGARGATCPSRNSFVPRVFMTPDASRPRRGAWVRPSAARSSGSASNVKGSTSDQAFTRSVGPHHCRLGGAEPRISSNSTWRGVAARGSMRLSEGQGRCPLPRPDDALPGAPNQYRCCRALPRTTRSSMWACSGLAKKIARSKVGPDYPRQPDLFDRLDQYSFCACGRRFHVSPRNRSADGIRQAASASFRYPDSGHVVATAYRTKAEEEGPPSPFLTDGIRPGTRVTVGVVDVTVGVTTTDSLLQLVLLRADCEGVVGHHCVAVRKITGFTPSMRPDSRWAEHHVMLPS